MAKSVVGTYLCGGGEYTRKVTRQKGGYTRYLVRDGKSHVYSKRKNQIKKALRMDRCTKI